jgi:2-methylisocitrate lyase-like PEP mutase family enzyme
MSKTSLRDLLSRPGVLTLPGVYDGISARVANNLGFPALGMTCAATAPVAWRDTVMANGTHLERGVPVVVRIRWRSRHQASFARLW